MNSQGPPPAAPAAPIVLQYGRPARQLPVFWLGILHLLSLVLITVGALVLAVGIPGTVAIVARSQPAQRQAEPEAIPIIAAVFIVLPLVSLLGGIYLRRYLTQLQRQVEPQDRGET